MTGKIFRFYPTLLLGSSLMPLAASAQPSPNIIIGNIVDTFELIIGLFFVIATVVFLWGVIQFVSKAENEAERNKAKAIMTWGIIGLAVMAATWGIVQILLDYFGVGGFNIPGGPQTP